MGDVRRFFARLVATCRRRRTEDDVARQVTAHLTLLEDEYRRRGLAPGTARRTARLSLGGAEQTRTLHREARMFRWVDDLHRDLRVAVRRLARAPASTAAAILTLTLGFGANIAILTLVDRVILHPLAVPIPDRLVTPLRTYQARGAEQRQLSMNWSMAERVRAMSSWHDVAVSSGAQDAGGRQLAISSGTDSDHTADGRFVSHNYLRTLGLRPGLGRDFEPTDDVIGGQPVALLSHRYWRTRFGSDPDAVGATLRINGTPTVVVGVLPPTFTGLELSVSPPDIFLPLMTASRLATFRGLHNDGEGRMFNDTQSSRPAVVSPLASFTVVGRLRASEDHRGAAELRTTARSQEWTLVPVSTTMLPFAGVADLQRFMALLAGVGIVTLLVGCANLAGLLLARAEQRRQELAVCAALGAGRAALARSAAAEACLLAVAGGASALYAAGWIEEALAVFVLPGGVAIAALPVSSATRVTSLAVVLVAIAALLISLGPAVFSARQRLATRIGAHKHTMRLAGTRVLLGLQVALCTVLVVLGSLFVRTVSNALAASPGFDANGLVSASVSVSGQSMQQTFDDFLALETVVDRLRHAPGIEAASLGPLPLVRGADFSRHLIRVDGQVLEPGTPVDQVYAAPEYFSTLRVPLLRGRGFTDGDRDGSEMVAVVNESAARAFWPNVDPVGRRVAFPLASTMPMSGSDLMVVGVVQDITLRTIGDTDAAIVYLARSQHLPYLAGASSGTGSAFIVARASGDPGEAVRSIASVAAGLGRSVTVTRLDDRVAELLMPQRLGRTLLILLGGVALTLTVVGVYGLTACVVAGSTREIGVRMALGGAGRRLVGTLLTKALLPVVAGMAIGVVPAWWAGQSVDRFLFGLHGADGASMAFAVTAILGGAVLATVLPARRALAVNPIDVLRAD